jgi:hypothetical protein
MNTKGRKETVRKVYTYTTFNAPRGLGSDSLLANVDNLYIVFFTPNTVDPVKGFFKIVPRTNKSTGFKFYGMKSSKYGAKVPSDATHMSLAVLGKNKVERLYTMEVPRPLSKTTVHFQDGSKFVMQVRRSSSNMFVAIGDTYKDRMSERQKINEQIKERWIQL